VYDGSAQHFGWLAGATVVGWDRGIGPALARDFNFTTDGTFQVDVANGTYRVDLLMGDLGQYEHDQVDIFLQDDTEASDTADTLAGELLSLTFDAVEVTDGHLKIRLKDTGGTDPNAVLQAVDIALL